MGSIHQTSQWTLLRREMLPILRARLPHPCPRCGQVMEKGQHLDLGHISRSPLLRYERSNVRLEHRSCNRRHGQSITSAIRGKKSKELPSW